MLNKVFITWSFEDTEFEMFQYEEARKAAGLPKSKKINIDEEEIEVEDYLYETYGFVVESWSYDE
jgi:hypothetical protein